MDKCIDSLGEKRMFSTKEANSGYWQRAMDVKDVNKYAFMTLHCLFKYTWMLLELKNPLATFQRSIKITL